MTRAYNIINNKYINMIGLFPAVQNDVLLLLGYWNCQLKGLFSFNCDGICVGLSTKIHNS